MINSVVRGFRVRGQVPLPARKLHVAPPSVTPPRFGVDQERPAPEAMPLPYLLAPFAHLATHQTEQSVWQSASVRDAWQAFYAAYTQTLEHDPLRALELRQKDLVLLSMCTSRAETLHLLSLLPPTLRDAIKNHSSFSLHKVEEIFLHEGQMIEVRGAEWVFQLPAPSRLTVQHILQHLGSFGTDGRLCIANTAHRVSAWRDRHGTVVGVTMRVGRYVPNAAQALLPLARHGNLLIISPAGTGKTTLLRDIAATLAHERGSPRVVIVDTSSEIGGDGSVPMPFLGRCRRLQVSRRDSQGDAMLEVIQNHTPDHLVVDELMTSEEARAAWTAALRGVRLVATCHGTTLAGLLQNQDLNDLVGGTAQAFLSNEERRMRNKTRKSILERPYASPFNFVVEFLTRRRGFVYVDVDAAVDYVLDDKDPKQDCNIGAHVDLTQPPSVQLEELLRRWRQKRRDAYMDPVPSGTMQDDNEYTTTS